MIKKSVLTSLAIIISLLFSACVTKQEPVSIGVKKVVEAMFNCPNDDLFNSDMVVMVGLGVEMTEEEKEKAREASEIAFANWEESVGEYFGYGFLKAFINSGVGQYYHARILLDEEIALESITLTEKDDAIEILRVDFLVNGEPRQTGLKFYYDLEGLIKYVMIVEWDS